MALKSRNKISVNFNMASMTDIVFLLLVFFIIASTLITPNGLKVLLPKSSARTTGKQNISVSITPDLKYYVNQEEVSPDQLEYVLKAKLAGEEKPGIILRADKTVPLEYAVKVMDIANRNKFQLVLATKAK
ncbi:MAG: biopolymer transporter ExbD [Bacteroidetes bacterium]|nr:MAG: biopolymer transporter ExbD [Bacteroidota bacterium]